MNRLTKRNGHYCDDCGYEPGEFCACNEEIAMYERLKQYEDAEEQDRLVEVRHGHWEFEDDDCVTWCTKAICSSCKQTVALNADLAQDWGKRLFLKDNLFCAKCGAKMDGGQGE